MKTSRLFLLVFALSLTGCASMGEEQVREYKIGSTTITTITHKQTLPDWLIAPSKRKFNLRMIGTYDQEKRSVVAQTEILCHDTVADRPGILATAGTTGVLFALFDGLTFGLGSKAFPGANPSSYRRYGAWAGGGSGTASGTISGSGGRVYEFNACGADTFSLVPEARNIRASQSTPW